MIHKFVLINYRNSQYGVALFVAMVMTLILSILGITAIRSSTLEYSMAVNAIRSAATFQAAESASNQAMNSVGNLLNAYDAGLNNNFIFEVPPVNTSIGLDTVSTLAYTGQVPISGFSAGVGNNFVALVFVANGIGTIDNAGTQSNIEQGVYRIVPAN